MCKRNSPVENESSMGYVGETPDIKLTPSWDVYEKLLDKKEANTGCVRETPHIKTKSGWDM